MKKGKILSIIGFVLIVLSIILYSLDVIFFFFGPIYPVFIYSSLIIFTFGLIIGYIICFINILRLKSDWPRKLSKAGVFIPILIIFIINVILLVTEYSSQGLLSISFLGSLLFAILIVFGAVLLMIYDKEKSKKVWKIVSIILGILFFVLTVLVVIYSLIFYVFLFAPQ